MITSHGEKQVVISYVIFFYIYTHIYINERTFLVCGGADGSSYNMQAFGAFSPPTVSDAFKKTSHSCHILSPIKCHVNE